MNFISKYKVIPIFFENNNLHLALTLPFKTDFFKAFEQLNTKVNLQLYTISENEFEYLRKPIMNAMEHANSPKIASPKDSGLPTPSGSGKTADSS